jgi:hypothetical protein
MAQSDTGEKPSMETRGQPSAARGIVDAPPTLAARPNTPSSDDHADTGPVPPEAPGSPVRTIPEPPKVPQARDIRLEVAAGERRIEVHVTERAGDVHVAVRTSDSRLSNALRDNLPALSSRLEESGYRADGWQTGSSASDRNETLAAHGSNPSDQHNSAGQDSQPQQQQQRHPRAQHPEAADQPTRKQKGDQFSWLMSSLG